MSTRTPRPGELFKPKPARGPVPGDLARGIAPKPPTPAKPPTKHTGPKGPRGPGMSKQKPISKPIARKAVKPATRDGKH